MAVVLQAANSTAATVVGIIGFGVVGLSVGIITGLGGQLSLGQYAVAGVGGVVFVLVADHGGNAIVAFAYAAAAAAVAGLLVGLPSLRSRGLFLTVSTLAFALALDSWGLSQPWGLGAGRSVRVPVLLGHPLETGHAIFGVAVVAFALGAWLCRNVRTSGFGRLMVAVRDNEDNARAFGVRVGVVKAQGLALAGAIAGLGGALVAVSLAGVNRATFPVEASVDVVAMAVIGGLSMLSGPLLGALYILGLPQFVHLDSAGLAASRFGWLILILYVPGGLAQLLDPVRTFAYRLLARLTPAPSTPSRNATVVPLTSARSLADLVGRNPARPPGGGPLLEARQVTKEFGGVHAVSGVSLTVDEGEIVGLIGPNGAGKTTLFELLGGFTRADSGSVWFDGADVTRLSPERRAGLGLVRSFQDAALFPTMTVTDAVAVALERVSPTRVVESVAGFHGRDRHRRALAADVITLMGLDGYSDTRLSQLSTGTRRIAELACLVAVRPRLLLLDEPSSGIAQRETEALGGLLFRIARELGVTLCVIEHDIPLIMSISTRIVAMDAGTVIAEGPPDVVRRDERVATAYLGGKIEAIERSGGGRVPVHQGGRT